MSFPNDIWEYDDSGSTDEPMLSLLPDWIFGSEKGYSIGTDWRLRTEQITGTEDYRLEATRLATKAVFQVGPNYAENAGRPLESTITQFLSWKGNYDLYVDVTLNRLADVDVPVYGTMMIATDGQPYPKWFLYRSADYGSTWDRLLEIAPDNGNLRVGCGSVTCKMQEVGSIGGLSDVGSTGSYYVDGSVSGLPVAEAGVLEHWQNPYSEDQAVQRYQSFVTAGNRYVRVKNSGTWGSWSAA